MVPPREEPKAGVTSRGSRGSTGLRPGAFWTDRWTKTWDVTPSGRGQEDGEVGRLVWKAALNSLQGGGHQDQHDKHATAMNCLYPSLQRPC